MPALEVKGIDWSGTFSELQGRQTINISRPEIMAAALSVGAPLLYIPFSNHAVSMAFFKVLGLACAVEDKGGGLAPPAQYAALDPTEKANISFWTGMAFAALVAERRLNVPFVWHVSSMVRSGRATKQGQSQVIADLLGQDRSGDWHVIEAKARQGSAPSADRERWKDQTQTIATVDGSVPATRSYCLTRVGDPYKVELVDPPDSELREHEKVALTTDGVVEGYYEPFRAWLTERSEAAAGPTFDIDRGVELKVRRAAFDAATQLYWFVGLRSDLLEVGSAKSSPTIKDVPFALDQGHVRADGIAVVASPEPNIT